MQLSLDDVSSNEGGKTMLDKNKLENFTYEKICGATGKKRYFHSKATKDSKHMRGRFDSNHAPYRCRHCGYFHIGSSESPRTRSKARRRQTHN